MYDRTVQGTGHEATAGTIRSVDIPREYRDTAGRNDACDESHTRFTQRVKPDRRGTSQEPTGGATEENYAAGTRDRVSRLPLHRDAGQPGTWPCRCGCLKLDSVSRGKTVARVVFDRFLKWNDFADEDDARASIVDGLEQRGGPQIVALVEVAASNTAALGVVGAVSGDVSAAEPVSEVVVEIASEPDGIDAIAAWFTDGPA